MANLNTNEIISSIENTLQKTIDLQQQQLDNIKSSFEKAKQFLLENNKSEITEDDDIIIEVMNSLKEIKENISSNEKDIKNIKNSIKSLESLSNAIDDSITKQLENKIEGISKNNEMFTSKLKDAKTFLDILLSLEIVCPSCDGSKNSINNCSFCRGRGVVNISKILENQKLLDEDFISPIPNTYNNQYQSNNDYNTQNYNQNVNNPRLNNSPSTKFVINKKK